jgi:hypothetical protein
VTVTTAAAHGLAVGAYVNIWQPSSFAYTNFPLGLRQVASVISPTQYTYNDALNTGALVWPGLLNQYQQLTADSTSLSTNDAAPNRLFISGAGQPECAPVQQFIDIGSKLSKIVRIIALRESCFILKDLDGVWRLTGDDPSTFVVRQFDPTIKILAPDSAVSLGNQIHFLSNQGVVQLSDAGASIISRPIETDLFSLRQLSPTNYANLSFGVAYESDHKYILGTTTAGGDTTPNQMWVYNLFTRAWTRWTIAAPCGAVDPALDLLYFGTAASNATQERKNYAASDFQDALGVAIASNVQYNVQFGENPGLLKQFTEVDFLFGLPTFSAATLGFASDLDNAEETVAQPGFLTSTFPRSIRQTVPRNKQSASLLQIRFAHSVAAERWNIRGLVLTYEDMGERISR